ATISSAALSAALSLRTSYSSSPITRASAWKILVPPAPSFSHKVNVLATSASYVLNLAERSPAQAVRASAEPSLKIPDQVRRQATPSQTMIWLLTSPVERTRACQKASLPQTCLRQSF